MKQGVRGRKITRLAAAALCAALLGNMAGAAAPATAPYFPEYEMLSTEPVNGPREGDLSPDALQSAALDAQELPETIELAHAQGKNHVKRLRAQEEADNIVVFQNKDGSKTSYVYAQPVKYTDETGRKKDKSTKVKALPAGRAVAGTNGRAYAFENGDNSVKAYFPHALDQTGRVVLTQNETRLSLSPVSSTEKELGPLSETEQAQLDGIMDAGRAQALRARVTGDTRAEGTPALTAAPAVAVAVTQAGMMVAVRQKEDAPVRQAVQATAAKAEYVSLTERPEEAVTYEGVFGPGTTLRYTPTLDGVKEDIILSRYEGRNSFTFLLETGGLRLVQDAGGGFYFADPLTGEERGKIGEIAAFDAGAGDARRETHGVMTATELEEDTRYELTVTVDAAFLTDEAVQYPVCIDPTYVIWEHNNAYQQVLSLGIYSYTNDITRSDVLYAGDKNGGTARALIRFPGIASGVAFPTSDVILNAELQFTAAPSTNTSSRDVEASAYTGVPWNNNMSQCNWGLWNSAIGQFGGRYTYGGLRGQPDGPGYIDITNLAKQWTTDNAARNNGLVLTGDSNAVTIYSTRHSDFLKRPYLSFTTIPAAQSYKILPIPMIHQEKTNWCWAACAQVIANVYGTTKYVSQKKLAEEVLGSDQNWAAMGMQMSEGVNFALTQSTNETEYYYVDKYHVAPSYTPPESIVAAINRGKPVYISKSTVPGSDLHSHDMLIYGYEKYAPSAQYGYFFYIYDPNRGDAARTPLRWSYNELFTSNDYYGHVIGWVKPR